MIQTLLSLLSPLSPVRPEGVSPASLPALTVTKVGDQLLHRADGCDYARRHTFQVDAFAACREEALSLHDQACRLLTCGPFSFSMEAAYEDFDDQLLTYRAGGRYVADAMIKEDE